MRILTLLTFVLPLVGITTAAGPARNKDPEAAAAKRINVLLHKYQASVDGILKKRKTGCTSKTVLRRKEWGTLSKKDRLSYITALKCLANRSLSPPQTPLSLIPGVRARYDDFVGSHLLRTPFVHANGLFLAYHRHFGHLFERALRDECGYKGGAQPYWDWTQSYRNVTRSPLFDGSAFSLGSNGVFIPNRTATEAMLPDGRPLTIFPGSGGGCIASGPFTADQYVMNLGPEGNREHNPRCVSRDLNAQYGQYTKPSDVLRVLETCEDMACFMHWMDEPQIGMHGTGHIQLGGVELDVFVSPGDPAFWLHHAMVDRVWSIWQHTGKGKGQGVSERMAMVWGTETNFNVPPSPNVTLDTPIDLGGIIGPTVYLKELVSSIDGPHCHVYE